MGHGEGNQLSSRFRACKLDSSGMFSFIARVKNASKLSTVTVLHEKKRELCKHSEETIVLKQKTKICFYAPM